MYIYIYIYTNMYIYIYIYRERVSREKTRFNKPQATQVLILLKIPQQTFQRRFNVVFRLIWCRDVALPRINVETMLCMSTLKFTT